jgi:hypothetical protein
MAGYRLDVQDSIPGRVFSHYAMTGIAWSSSSFSSHRNRGQSRRSLKLITQVAISKINREEDGGKRRGEAIRRNAMKIEKEGE